MVMTDEQFQPIFDAVQARSRALFAAAWESLVAQSKAKGDARFAAVDTGEGVGLIVSQASYGKAPAGISDDDWMQAVVDRKVDPVELVASQDGRHIDRSGWHEGEASDDDWIYYERWTAAGRVSHGYVDKVSRRLLQSG